jgi:cytoskeletal protein CcmA (bactofilin family)
MAANVTVIGRTTRVRGRIVGPGDVEVQGFVEGEIAVGGDATVDTHGLVGANIRGRRLVVRGAVKGDLVGEEAIVLEDGARVVGDVRAPRVAVSAGALVRGYVETGESTQASARAARAGPTARPVPFVQSKGANSAAKAAAPPPLRTAAKPAAISSVTAAGASGASSVASTTSSAAAAPAAKGSAANRSALRRPPPPVVPVLKKIKGQIATKKKER